MAVRQGGGLAGIDELLASVLPDRLEHPVARRRAAIHDHERPVDEPREPVDQVDAGPSARDRRPRSGPRSGPSSRPVNTDSRRSRRRSSSVRRSQLQSMSACSVCWRGTAVRRPPASSRNRSPSRLAMSSGDIAETRAAASSIASGMPSRRRQISATEADVRRAERERRVDGRGALGEQPDGLGRGRVLEVDGIVRRSAVGGPTRATGRTATGAGARPRPGPRAPRGSWSGCAGPARSRAAARRAARRRRRDAPRCRAGAADPCRRGTP